MYNLWKAIFLEVIFQEWCADKGFKPVPVVRRVYAHAFMSRKFKFEVRS